MVGRRGAGSLRTIMIASLLSALLAAVPLLTRPGFRALALSPEAAAARMKALPQERRLELVMGYGHLCGLLCDLDRIGERALALGPDAWGPFLDGAGHAWSPSSADAEEVAREIERALIPVHRHHFVDAAALQRTLQSPEQPGEVVAWVERLEARTGADATNGVRIGFQQARGGDLPRALPAVAAWPERLWIPMAEELGWRAGDEARLAELPALMALAPAPAACAVAQGAARGAALRRTQDGIEPLALRAVLDESLRLAPACADHLRLGLAWALRIRLAGPRAQALLDALADPALRTIGRDLVAADDVGPPWLGPASSP